MSSADSQELWGRWEDEERADNDLITLKQEFRERLYGKYMTKHIIMTSADCRAKHGGKCPYDGEMNQCPICDWGLNICKVCGKAEIELRTPCTAPRPPTPFQDMSYTDKADQLAMTADLCEERGATFAASVLREEEKKYRLSAEITQR